MAKRLWGVLRVTFFMIRKGLISKRKLIMDMNMMMKRGKLWRKTLNNLMFHHHHHKHVAARGAGAYGIQEYEFSCSNSPNPVFFRALKRKHAHNYFPCINPPEVIEEEEDEQKEFGLLVPKTPECYTSFNNFQNLAADNAVQAEKLSPLLFSPFSVRVSNYSSEDESGIEDDRNGRVDDAAEEFIRRFYEQLRVQSRTQLLQYPEE
ncbi:uncharacterized protein LOC116197040 [Punica granatum]|nr:uncharacterized protein LOC116197040 [Punica granatum]